MSDKVQIVCKGCEATLAMAGTAEDIVNRKVRCPKCQMKFVARPEMIRVVSATKTPEAAKSPAKTALTRKPARVAEEIIDDDVEILDDDDELPDITPPRSSKSKRPPKDDFDDDDDLDDLPVSPKKKKDNKPKKKVKKAPTRSFGAAVVLWTLGGIAGGFLCGGLWWVIDYTTGFNAWFFGVLMGTAVGAGVRLGAAQYEGWKPALTAVFITLAALFFTKLALNFTLYADDISGFGVSETATASYVASMNEEELIAAYINDIVGPEYTKQGKPIDHPQLEDDDYDWEGEKGAYHPDLWKDAETRWRALPQQEQAAFRQNLIDKELGIDRESLIHRIIEKEVKAEFAQQNKPVELTEAEQEASDYEEIYTAEALQEATKRYEAQTPEQRAALVEVVRAERVLLEQTFEGVQQGIQVVMILAWTIFGFLWPGNLVCTILACISAWQIGNYDGVTT